MSTITTRAIVQEMLDGDGAYPGDSQTALIYEYRNALTERVAWAVFLDPRRDDMGISPTVGEYRLLWSRDMGHVSPIGCLEGQ